jgi:glycosyltransferase involved in cell wall biosynthesis
MRLGAVHWGFPPRGGGVEAHLITVLPEIVKQGIPVFVLTETMEGQPEESEVQGIKVWRRDELAVSRLEGQPDIYGKAKQLFCDFIDENQIDVIQAHNLQMDYYDLSKALSDACQQRDLPCYLIIHNHEFIDRNPKVMISILADIPWAKLVPISVFVESKLKQLIPRIPREKWQVILHGIDLDVFHPLEAQERARLKAQYGFSGRKIILHPARILRWKGIVPAIRAMPDVLKRIPQALMVLTGRIKPIFKDEGEIRDYNLLVDQTVSELKLQNQVHIGNYSFSDLPKLTAISDVVIYTTIGEEPFGLCPVEGMASRVPAVVTRSGGLVESVVDGQTGLLIDRDETLIPGQLADRVINILSDPALAARMGDAGRKLAERKFDKKRMARDLIELSHSLARSQQPPFLSLTNPRW